MAFPTQTEYACVITHGLLPRLLKWERGVLEAAKKLYVADGASQWAPLSGRKPDYWAGDGDSGARPAVLLNREKDVADGEFVLRHALERGERKILWLGALGGQEEFDWSHLDLLRQTSVLYPSADVMICHELLWIRYIHDKKCILRNLAGISLSLWAPSPQKTPIQTEGLRYNLKGAPLVHATHGIHNEVATEDASIACVGGGVFLALRFAGADARPGCDACTVVAATERRAEAGAHRGTTGHRASRPASRARGSALGARTQRARTRASTQKSQRQGGAVSRRKSQRAKR